MINFFDFSTIYTAILTSNLLLAIIAVIVRNEKIMINAGYKLITIFLGVTVVRFLLPIQFPFVTTIPLPQGISSLFVPLFTPLFKVSEIKVNPLRLLALVWIIGILIQGYRCYKANQMIYARVYTTGRDVSKDTRYVDIVNDFCGQKASSLRIFEVPNLESPLIFGFFKPFILLPADFPCTDKELTYILKHEVTHYLHQDLLIKFLTRLLTIIYWWNPFGYLLYNQMNLALEMRIDDTVTDTNNKETTEYLQCLIHLAEYQDNAFCNPMGNTISFTRSDEKILTKRFQMLVQRKQKKKKILNLFLICLVSVIYLFSYLVIFEAYAIDTQTKQGIIQIDKTNSFLVDNGDGTYDLYFCNYKMETINSLDYYGDDIPIYTSEEFERVQQEDPE